MGHFLLWRRENNYNLRFSPLPPPATVHKHPRPIHVLHIANFTVNVEPVITQQHQTCMQQRHHTLSTFFCLPIVEPKSAPMGIFKYFDATNILNAGLLLAMKCFYTGIMPFTHISELETNPSSNHKAGFYFAGTGRMLCIVFSLV